MQKVINLAEGKFTIQALTWKQLKAVRAGAMTDQQVLEAGTVHGDVIKLEDAEAPAANCLVNEIMKLTTGSKEQEKN